MQGTDFNILSWLVFIRKMEIIMSDAKNRICIFFDWFDFFFLFWGIGRWKILFCQLVFSLPLIIIHLFMAMMAVKSSQIIKIKVNIKEREREREKASKIWGKPNWWYWTTAQIDYVKGNIEHANPNVWVRCNIVKEWARNHQQKWQQQLPQIESNTYRQRTKKHTKTA